MFLLAIIVILSYLVGSVPTGIIVTKFAKGIDIRNHGSGNAGGTNVMRILGWKHGFLVILLDTLKGALAVVVVARLYFGPLPFANVSPFDDFTLVQIIAGISAVIGHVWTVFAGFKGGKGIATALGMLIMIITVEMLIALGVFVLVVTISKYVSLGSLSAAISIPISLILRENVLHEHVSGYTTILPFVIFLAFFVIYTHRKNVIKIFNGTENKLNFKKKQKS